MSENTRYPTQAKYITNNRIKITIGIEPCMTLRYLIENLLTPSITVIAKNGLSRLVNQGYIRYIDLFPVLYQTVTLIRSKIEMKVMSLRIVLDLRADGVTVLNLSFRPLIKSMATRHTT